MRDETSEAKALEAFGVLTRSATHDLNNQMTAIMTFADFVLEALPASHPIRHEIEEIRYAGERAVAKTRELAMLARRLSPIGRRAS
jgi:signal transduction histidine kinase